jgi:hypothetical protein
MEACEHENLDAKGVQAGYVLCKTCGRSVPIERLIVKMVERIAELEADVKRLSSTVPVRVGFGVVPSDQHFVGEVDGVDEDVQERRRM